MNAHVKRTLTPPNGTGKYRKMKKARGYRRLGVPWWTGGDSNPGPWD